MFSIILPSGMDWIVPLQNSYVETFTPYVTVLESRVFREIKKDKGDQKKES